MITFKILTLIVNMCAGQIDPRFIPDVCASFMLSCVQDGGSFDDCSEFFEPLAPEAADLSY